MKKTNTGLVEFVKSKLGCPYWYGCFGQKGSASLLNNKIKQYPKYYTKSRIARCRKQYGKQVFDCVGLIKAYMWLNDSGKIIYHSSQDVSADGMLAKCNSQGKISNMPEIKGLLLFMKGHVGVYIGNGYAIEATIHDNAYAVVKSKVEGRGWTHWGKCPYIDYIVEDKKKSQVITTNVPAKDNKYFKKYTGNSTSLVDALASLNINHSWSYRRKIAKANYIRIYMGTSKQNTTLLNLLKKGKLVKPLQSENL